MTLIKKIERKERKNGIAATEGIKEKEEEEEEKEGEEQDKEEVEEQKDKIQKREERKLCTNKK